MLDLWTILLPILLADILNPVLFAFMVYTVGTQRPLLNSSAALLGHTVSYLGFGIVVAYAFETITTRLANPESVDFGVGLLIGILLLWVAWRSRNAADKQTKKAPKVEQLTLLKVFGTGALINIIGLPFALPYFAALDQILKANLSTLDSLMLIGAYNIGYALPFLVVPVLAFLLGERSRPLLARINEKVERVSAMLMPFILAVVGLALVVDAMLYFMRGEGLF